MPQTIVFDLFGVIARTQTGAARHHIEELAGVSGEPFWDAYWAGRPSYDAGQSSAEYSTQVAARLGVEFDAETVGALTEADLSSWTEVDSERNVVAAREAGMTAEVFASAGQVRALLARA